MAMFKALIIGIAFWDIGSTFPLNQMSFLFMMLQMSAMAAMQKIPEMIVDRTVMKFEVSDRLYSEWAYITVSFLKGLLISTLSNLLFFVVAFAMAGMDWSR